MDVADVVLLRNDEQRVKEDHVDLFISKGMLDGSHLAFLEEDDVDYLRVTVALVDQHVVVDFPLRDLLLHHLVQDSLAVFSPHLEDVRALVVLFEIVGEDLNLEDAEVGCADCGHVVVAMVFYPVQPEFYIRIHTNKDPYLEG